MYACHSPKNGPVLFDDAAGRYTCKKSALPKESLGVLSRLVTLVFLPCYAFCSTYSGNTRSQLMDGLPMLGLALLFYLALAGLFAALARLLKLEGPRGRVFQALFVFGNTGFIGLPVLQSLYGGDGAIAMALFSIVDQAVLWSYGLWLCSGKGGFSPRRLLNPCLLAILAAVILVATGLRLPPLAMDTLQTLGGANGAVCMLYLGALLCYSDLHTFSCCKELYWGIAVKMLAFPVVVWLALRLLGIAGVTRGVLVVLAGLPTMTVIPMLAKDSDGQQPYAAAGAMITLIASIVTMPLVALLL